MPVSIDPKLRLSLTNDFVFKAVLTSSQEVLIALLTAVLKPHSPIESARVLNPELPKDFEDDKGGFLDVAVVLEDGTRIDVEMQARRRGVLSARALFYWAGLFSRQLALGQDHSRLARTVSVLFLDYREFPFSQFHEVFRIRGEQTGIVFSPLLEMHTIELPKLRRLQGSVPVSDQALVRWSRYLATKDPHEIQQLATEDPMIEKAEEKVTKLSTDPHLRELALERERRQIAEQIIRTAAWDEAVAEGRERGLAEGRAEGQRGLLGRQLERKFHALPEELRRRLEHASEAELTTWAERLVDATTLGDVFG
jgi:predicted transposase/invertase (TIGR01784 family)